MPEHTIQSDYGPDLVFAGELMVSVSTPKRAPADAVPENEGKRWTELSLYKTDSGRYVVHVVGKTTVPDERDRNRAQECQTVEEVVKALQQPGREARPTISPVSKRLLKEAAIVDSAFKGILSKHV